MNAFGEAFRAALASLNAHRLRSFLTTLGILIGTMAVIAVVSVLQGFSDSIRDQFSDLGSNSLTLEALNDQENFRTGRINTLSFEDIEVLRGLGILVDGGAPRSYLLQIFMKEQAGIFADADAGPFFVEIIQRKGDRGFGAGNFRALFESIERDQKAAGRLG